MTSFVPVGDCYWNFPSCWQVRGGLGAGVWTGPQEHRPIRAEHFSVTNLVQKGKYMGCDRFLQKMLKAHAGLSSTLEVHNVASCWRKLVIVLFDWAG